MVSMKPGMESEAQDVVLLNGHTSSSDHTVITATPIRHPSNDHSATTDAVGHHPSIEILRVYDDEETDGRQMTGITARGIKKRSGFRQSLIYFGFST